ncbi:MAG: apolipoprotein N-acyltransferase [Phycisphaerae bacterium]
MILWCGLSIVLLTLSFPPFDQFYLAYVALAPLVAAMVMAKTRRRALVGAYLTGLVFWALNLYWLTWITLVGYIPLVLVAGLFWLIACWLIRAAFRLRVPVWISLPLVWIAGEYVRAYMLSGFPWFFLAHSQYEQTLLIQIADVAGQYGVSFFVAMVNGVVFSLLYAGLTREGPVVARLRSKANAMGTAVTAGLLVGIIAYGLFRTRQETTRPGPVVGIVQAFHPIALGPSDHKYNVFEWHLELSRRFVGKDVDLVIWPETMLPAGMNRQFLTADFHRMEPKELRLVGFFFFGPVVWSEGIPDQEIAGRLEAYVAKLLRPKAETLAEHTREGGFVLLAGGTSFYKDPDPLGPRHQWVMQNSALSYAGDWKSRQHYSKQHLVPFSESVPFRRSWPWLHKKLRWFVPEEMPQLVAGLETREFTVSRGQERFSLVAPICYEGVFARVCRDMVYRNGGKADVLVNMSNDGWFVPQFGDPPYGRSTEHSQHLSAYVFRAIENRVPVLRSVNTGISASIDSEGRILSRIDSRQGTLLLDGQRDKEGKLLVDHAPKVLVDSRRSLYSVLGDVFAQVVSLAALALAVVVAWKARISRKEKDSK